MVSTTFTFHGHKTYTRSLSPWNTWPALYVLPVRPFACLFFSIKMNYRIALGNRDKERLLWCYPEALSQWVGERNRVLWIFWSLSLTPLRFLMDHTICNFSQTYESPVLVRKTEERGSEAWVYCSYVEVEGDEGRETGEARGLCLC